MKTRWYKDAVFYQIYPRSFKDSNGDGIGDIRGIIEKLDYLKELGIDAVWLSPCFKSPNDDNGYDISDYTDIMDEFGTLDDFKELLSGLHARGIRLILDLVVNHTSDEHPWFKESRKSKDNPYRDYYFWREKPPNDWRACFGGGAWELSPETGEHYLHLFSKKQPDLNWDNPKVRQEVADVCNFWLKLGVDGFRCDVITYVAKDFSGRHDNYVIGKHWQEYISELSKASFNMHDSFIVGECCGANAEDVGRICGEDMLDAVIGFDHLPWLKKYSLNKVKRRIAAWAIIPTECAWAAYFENHDQARSVSKFSAPAKALGAALLFLRGVPFIFQGQELGMTNIDLEPSDYRDIQSVNQISAANGLKRFFVLKHLKLRARDHARTPMQWSGGENAGFTNGTPWMKINPNYAKINAENELRDENSVLNYYKRLISLRKQYIEIVRDGDFKFLNAGKRKTFAFTRTLEEKTLKVICDFKRGTVRIFFNDVLIDSV